MPKPRKCCLRNHMVSMVSKALVMRFSFRIVLPGIMVAVLFYTLHVAEQEDRKWIAQRASDSQRLANTKFLDSILFLPPFEHSNMIRDAVGFQWPAFAVAGLVAPVPEMFYSGRKAIPLTRISYVVLTLAVVAYWFLIGSWLYKRLIQRRPPSHSMLVRILLKVLAVPTILLFILFLGKDLIGGWPEGPQGAYGITAWLALVSTMQSIELGLFLKATKQGSAQLETRK
jgi:hypothetical protein